MDNLVLLILQVAVLKVINMMDKNVFMFQLLSANRDLLLKMENVFKLKLLFVKMEYLMELIAFRLKKANAHLDILGKRILALLLFQLHVLLVILTMELHVLLQVKCNVQMVELGMEPLVLQ